MPVTMPVPVRLDDRTIARLDAAAERIGSNRTALIRFCLETWLTHFEKHGRAALPPDWEEIQREYDGRTRVVRADRAEESRPCGKAAAQPALDDSPITAADKAAAIAAAEEMVDKELSKPFIHKRRKQSL